MSDEQFCMCLIVTWVLRFRRRSLGLISASALTYLVLWRYQVLKSKHYPVSVEMFDQFIIKFRWAKLNIFGATF